MTRAEQWRTEGRAATMFPRKHAHYGVTAHLCARILDLQFEENAEILARIPARAPANAPTVDVLARAHTHDRGETAVATVEPRIHSTCDV